MKFWKDAEEMVRGVHFCGLATVNQDGSPRITPIGSLFLTGVGKGFYFEKLPKAMRENLDRNGRFCILIQRGGMVYWLKALLTGRFNKMPALRLSGTAGNRRSCTPEENQCFDARFGRFKALKGYGILWKDMHTVRDIKVETIEPVNLLSMTEAML